MVKPIVCHFPNFIHFAGNRTSFKTANNTLKDKVF